MRVGQGINSTLSSRRRARVEVIALGSAYLALVLVYLFSFGRTAWSPNDPEYVMACAWRLIHGEIPYRDFIYHKPPGTLWLHRVWLLFPDGWAIVASRVFFYLQMAASGLLPILWARRAGLISFSWRLPALGAMALVFALHNFPVMPWQTSDGIFFATIGLVALMESRRGSLDARALVARIVASASLTAALLCKQSFFSPALLMGLIALGESIHWLFVDRQLNSDPRPMLKLLAASALPALSILGYFFFYLLVNSALEQFLLQFRSQSSGSALLAFGLLYRDSGFRWVIVASAFLPCLRRIGARSGEGFWISRICAAVFLLLLAQLARTNASEAVGDLGAVLFFILLGTFLGNVALRIIESVRHIELDDSLTDSRMLCMHLFLLTIAWSTQLSLGYYTPVLGMAGLGLLLHHVLPEERSISLDLFPAILATAIVAVCFWNLNQQKPYRDLSRENLTADLGRISPKLSGIKTNPGLVDTYAELKLLVERFAFAKGRPFVMLAEFPGAYWMWNARNPIHLDWLLIPEMDGFERELQGELDSSGAVAILPKGEPTPCEEIHTSGHNALAKAVVEHWRLIGSGTAFCVYSQ